MKIVKRANEPAIRSAALLAVAALLFCAGCPQTGPESSITVPEEFSAPGCNEMPDRWWEAFQDPDLNLLVDRAQAENRDLLMAWDRLDQAYALSRMADSALWPNLNANLSYSDSELLGEEQSAGVMGFNPTMAYEISSWTLAFTAAYELDLWGRVRSAVSASRQDLAATREDLDSLAMTISGEVARAWYELVELDCQTEVLTEQLAVNQTYLELLELRFEQGLAGAAEVMQQRQQLESVRGEMELVCMRRDLTAHRLAVFLGMPPDADPGVKGGTLPWPSPLPETGIPADLLLRRPDVRSAKARLNAADFRVAEAVAARFPTISISLSAQDTEQKIESLFDNWIKNLAVNLMAPIFDAGRRRAEVERNRAARSERLHSYEGVILGALREVEDALTQERAQTAFIRSLDEQLCLSRTALELAREQYSNGLIDYLPVLINLQSVQRLERAQTEAHRTLISYRINLYRALAGGWDMERPAAD